MPRLVDAISRKKFSLAAAGGGLGLDRLLDLPAVTEEEFRKFCRPIRRLRARTLNSRRFSSVDDLVNALLELSDE